MKISDHILIQHILENTTIRIIITSITMDKLLKSTFYSDIGTKEYKYNNHVD